jgi:hypothetical protein
VSSGPFPHPVTRWATRVAENVGRAGHRALESLTFTNDVMAGLLDQSLETAELRRRIRDHPLVPSSIPIYEYVYDVHTGRLLEVPESPPPPAEPRSSASRSTAPRAATPSQR